MEDYRLDIGVSSKYQFGVEIEFTGIYLDNLERVLKDQEFPARVVMSHDSRNINYKDWILDIDPTVSEAKDSRFYGGEFSSRILIDKKDTWLELKRLCQILKMNGGFANRNCSNHITVSLSYLKDESYFFEVLCKLLVLYENELEMFYMGDRYGIRDTKKEYARSLGLDIMCKMLEIDFNSPTLLYDLMERNPRIFIKHHAINLKKYIREELMEVRYPNGTVLEKVIQNNINFTLKFIDAIDRGVFSLEEINRKIMDHRGTVFEKLQRKQVSFEDFLYIVDRISLNQADQEDFVGQYERVVKSKKLCPCLRV